MFYTTKHQTRKVSVMSISFTGIKDCKVYKKEYTKNGIYMNEDGEFRRGNKNYNEVMMTARLTDDKDGDHLTQYLMSLPVGYENPKGYDLVNIHLTKFTPEENENDTYLPHIVYSDEARDTSMLELNGRSFHINSDNKLPIASFLAHMTKRDVDLTGLNANQKKYANVINNAIHEKACDYLDIDC